MLILPHNLPIAQILENEGFNVSFQPLGQYDEKAQHVMFVNLMPERQKTELDIARMIAPVAQKRDIQLHFMRFKGHFSKTTPKEHLENFYEEIDFDNMPENVDKLIISGAPLEEVEYEDVRYWSDFQQLTKWANEGGVKWLLNLCWAAFANLYNHYGIPMRHLPAKRFGLFPHKTVKSPILGGIENEILIPTSRHIELFHDDIAKVKHLQIVADSHESGPGIIVDEPHHEIDIVGHLEYGRLVLHEEYLRDLSRNKPIQPATHYYIYSSEAKPENVVHSWHEDSLKFYENFLNL